MAFQPNSEAAPALSGGRLARAVSRPSMGEAFDSTLAAARTGAEWAWTNLYRQFSPAVLGYFRAQCVPEPEDLTAEVFYQVVRSLGQFDGDETAFRSWVFVIAHRKIVDDSRHRKRRPVAPAEAQTLEYRGSSGDVEQEAMRHLSQGEVSALLAELTDNQRDVMLLRILGGLSLEETADVLNIRSGAVSALQNRAVKRLRKKLA